MMTDENREFTTTDNLRDRIAAALMDSLCAEIDKLGQYRSRYTPSDDNGEPVSGMWLGIDGTIDVMAVADAVIRELGLEHYCRECGGWGPMDD